jgi:hypothetical protein
MTATGTDASGASGLARSREPLGKGKLVVGDAPRIAEVN